MSTLLDSRIFQIFCGSSQAAASSRRLFLQRSTALTLAGGSAAILSGALSRAVGAADNEAHEIGAKAPQRINFEDIAQHEADHVTFLITALGADARPKPTFQDLEMKKFSDFATTAQTLENTGVGAYLGALPFINSAAYVMAAGSIATVEARHAGFLNTFLHDPITGSSADDDANPSFDSPLTAAEVAAAAGGFVASLNGGPDLIYSTTPSDANDIDILNSALALEYLEADFYAINVPKFYRSKK